MRKHLGPLFLLCMLAYIAILFWTYKVKIAPLYSYLGSKYRDPDVLGLTVAIILVIAVGALMPRALEKASDFVLWVFYVLAVVPAATVPQYADIISIDKSLLLALAVTGNFALVVILVSLDPVKASFRFKTGISTAIIAATTLLVYVYLLVTTGLSLQYIQLDSVRETRLGYRGAIETSGPLLGYLVRLQGAVLNPLIIAKGLSEKKQSLVIGGAIGQLALYSLTGYKITLISVPALILLAFMFRKDAKPAARRVLFGATGAAIAALVFDAVTQTTIATLLFIDRLILIPGTLTAAHIQVFDGQPKSMWSYSFLSGFVDNPYSTSPMFIVGARFSGNDEVTANANFFADGYANYGWLGVTIEALVLVIILWMLNAVSRHLPLRTVALMLLVPALSLVNGSVFTSILTGGFAFAFMLMMILPADDAAPVEKVSRSKTARPSPQEATPP